MVAPVPSMADLVAQWADYHLLKSAFAFLVVVALARVLGLLGRARPLLVGVIAVAATVAWLVVFANVQGALAPLASVVSLLPSVSTDARYAAALSGLRADLASGVANRSPRPSSRISASSTSSWSRSPSPPPLRWAWPPGARRGLATCDRLDTPGQQSCSWSCCWSSAPPTSPPPSIPSRPPRSAPIPDAPDAHGPAGVCPRASAVAPQFRPCHMRHHLAHVTWPGGWRNCRRSATLGGPAGGSTDSDLGPAEGAQAGGVGELGTAPRRLRSAR